MESKFFPALATLVGAIIGAGFLGIPYVVSKSGFFVGLFYLLFVSVFMLVIFLYLGEINLRTSDTHQLAGYAEKYLGKKGKYLMAFAMIFGIYPALLAYLIGEGRSLSYILFGSFDYAFHMTLVFWIVLFFFSYSGLRSLKKYEKISMMVVLTLVFGIIVYFFPDINFSNFNYIGDELFLPFGVILFSFLAFSSVPEVGRILSQQKHHMKNVIIAGISIPLVVYFLFTFVVIGVFDKNINEIATLSLGRFFALLGVFTMFTAFFTNTLAIRDMFRFDFKLGRLRGWILAIFIPIILFVIVYFIDGISFTEILSFAGIISGGTTGILILLMNKNAKLKGKRNPEYSIKINNWIIFILSLIFVLAVVLELFFV